VSVTDSPPLRGQLIIVLVSKSKQLIFTLLYFWRKVSSGWHFRAAARYITTYCVWCACVHAVVRARSLKIYSSHLDKQLTKFYILFKTRSAIRITRSRSLMTPSRHAANVTINILITVVFQDTLVGPCYIYIPWPCVSCITDKSLVLAV